jgi:hypothetical protein
MEQAVLLKFTQQLHNYTELNQENIIPFYCRSNLKPHIFKIGFSIRHSQEIRKKRQLNTYIQALQGNSE